MMKRSFLSLLVALVATSVAAQEVHWQEKLDTIWPGRHYREIDSELMGGYAGDQRRSEGITWNYAEGTRLVYGIHFPDGHVRGDAVVTAKSGQTANINFRIVYPATGEVVLEQTVSTLKKGAQETVEIMPDTYMPYDGWYRCEFTCPDGQQTLNRVALLLFQRESQLSITDSESFMAPSVHLWWSCNDPKAPSGQSFDWTYLECMYPYEYANVATYMMAIGTDAGYSGIQMPTRSDCSWGHSVLFSVWDNGDTDVDKNLPEHQRSGAVDLGPDTKAVRFGAEGTGASIRYDRDDLWEFDHWVQFLLNERPEINEVTITDANGNQSTMLYKSTLQSMWYKQAEWPEWCYIGTLRRSGDARMTSGFYSFIENFADGAGHKLRRGYYRNASMRSVASGKWYSLNSAGFGNTQNNGKRSSRYDFGHGITSLYDNAFFLQTGGYTGICDSAKSIAPVEQGQMPWVDTINVDRLRARVDKAIVNSFARSLQTKVDAASIVSDPAIWKVTAFSDEETEGEGDNGRAAQLLDGNENTYYHSRWKTNAHPYPHSFTIDAGSDVTFSSIALYQSRDTGYRAKTIQLYTSDNGTSGWQAVTNRMTLPDEERPVLALDEPVTARYIRIVFSAGYGSNLVINEMYFCHEPRIDDLKAVVCSLLEAQDQFGGYAPADLQTLAQVYDDGNVTDVEALQQAIMEVGRVAQPLTYAVVGKTEHITSFCAFQLHNAAGNGDLVVDAEGRLTVSGATVNGALDAFTNPTSVTELHNNWLILRSETYSEYYLYNMGAKQFLVVTDDGTAQLSEKPSPFTLTRSGDCFLIAASQGNVCLRPSQEDCVTISRSVSNVSRFELRNNYALALSTIEAQQLLSSGEALNHLDESIFLDAMTTYAKAFETTMDESVRLIRSASQLSSNVNANQQAEHNLSKLIDRNINTYWESWYANIQWPSEPGYVQARFTAPLQAFYLTFTPSQSEQYGQTDIPADVKIYAGNTLANVGLVKHLKDGLPQTIDDVYTSPAIFCEVPSQLARVEVSATLANRASGRVFAMSEMQMYPAVIDSINSIYFTRPWVKEAVDQLAEATQNLRKNINAQTATETDVVALREAINNAEAAYLLTDAVIDIPEQRGATNDDSRVFFDLSGRPVANDGANLRRGVYILHGQKVVVH